MKFKRILSLSLLSALLFGLSVAAVRTTKETSGAYVPTFAAYPTGDADTYYNEISDSLAGEDLLSALRTLNNKKRQKTGGYTNLLKNEFYARYTDYDINSVQYDANGRPYSNNIVSFYSGNLAANGSGMNREHVWPDSRGGYLVEADTHMARPTLTSENSARGNSFYVEGKSSTSAGWDPAMEKWGDETYRGDSARIIFYCVVANNGLSLVDLTNDNKDNHTMGKLSDILRWNVNYNVKQREMNRNEGVEYIQGNRNPFIDHPEYACRIWGNYNDATREACAGQIEKVDVTGVSLDRTTAEVGLNSTIKLVATVAPSNASIKTVTWTTSNASIATVASDGTVKGISEGTATITATTKDGGFTATCEVTVRRIAVTDVTLSKSELSLSTGQSYTLTANVLPSNASNKSVTWQSSNDAVATVSSSGYVRAISEGTATITATTVDGGFTATCAVTVTKASEPVHVQSISLNETRKELQVGETFQLEVTFNPSDATNKDVVWSVESLDDDAEYPSVLVNNLGLVTAVSEGYSLVTATTVDGLKTAECKFVVKNKSSSNTKSSGCGGNVVTSSVILSTLSILGIVTLVICKVKTKKEN